MRADDNDVDAALMGVLMRGSHHVTRIDGQHSCVYVYGDVFLLLFFVKLNARLYSGRNGNCEDE